MGIVANYLDNMNLAQRKQMNQLRAMESCRDYARYALSNAAGDACWKGADGEEVMALLLELKDRLWAMGNEAEQAAREGRKGGR